MGSVNVRIGEMHERGRIILGKIHKRRGRPLTPWVFVQSAQWSELPLGMGLVGFLVLHSPAGGEIGLFGALAAVRVCVFCL